MRYVTCNTCCYLAATTAQMGRSMCMTLPAMETQSEATALCRKMEAFCVLCDCRTRRRLAVKWKSRRRSSKRVHRTKASSYRLGPLIEAHRSSSKIEPRRHSSKLVDRCLCIWMELIEIHIIRHRTFHEGSWSQRLP